MLEKVRTQAERLLQLVESLLDLNRLNVVGLPRARSTREVEAGRPG